MNKSKVLTFFGSGDLAALSLDYLSSYFQVNAVITKAKPPHHKDTAPVEVLANKKNIPVFFANNATDLNELFRKSDIPTECGVVVDFGLLINDEIVNRFLLGIINSHFSLLPEWRGADPITYSILSGQNITGVSLMLIDKGLDTGKLIAQESIDIDPGDNNQSLSSKLIELSNDLLNKNLGSYMSGGLELYNQEPLPVTYSNKIMKLHGAMDWNKPSAVLEREIRAFRPWPGSFFVLKGIRLQIGKSRAIKDSAGPGVINIATPDKIIVGCRIGSLEILEVKPDGKNYMPVKAFINGYSSKIM